MEIKQLEPKDAMQYRSLRLEALQNSPDSFASSYEEEKEQTAEKYKIRFAAPTNTFTFGAFDDNQLVGVVTLIREQLMKLNHRASIVAMYTKPAKRGCGVGKALLNKAIKKAYTLEGIEQIYLTVVSTNVPAKKMYASCGFEVYGLEKRALKYNNTYYDEEQMVLFL